MGVLLCIHSCNRGSLVSRRPVPTISRTDALSFVRGVRVACFWANADVSSKNEGYCADMKCELGKQRSKAMERGAVACGGIHIPSPVRGYREEAMAISGTV